VRHDLQSVRGFTLVEILVVVVVIAIVTGVAVFSLGVLGGDRGLDAEGDRITDVMTATLEQAQLEGRDYGIQFLVNGYTVLKYSHTHGLWEPVANDALYTTYQLPAGIVATLELEGRQISLVPPKPPTATTSGARSTTDAPPAPQVQLFSSGDVSPYKLTLTREGTEYTFHIDGQADGTLLVTHAGQKRAQ
jgi:general secretion pathway protein H